MFFHFFKSFFCNLFLSLFEGEKTIWIVVVAHAAAACSYIQTAIQYGCTTIVGTVIDQRPSQTTARQYGQRLQVVGIHSIESEADTDSI